VGRIFVRRTEKFTPIADVMDPLQLIAAFAAHAPADRPARFCPPSQTSVFARFVIVINSGYAQHLHFRSCP
jgi:hypothetical protein